MKRWTIACVTTVLLFVLSLTVWAAEGDKPARQPELTVVNISSHCDWAWGHTRAWHEERYAETIRQVLLLMRKHPHYIWQLENENEQLAPFLKKAAKEWPELVEEFWQRVREGRIEVIVAISNPRISEVYPETFVRNLVLGKQYFRRHAPGIKQEVYSVVDLMCGHSQVPQILTQADYRYFMFSRPIDQQVVFWRKGLDGTRMLSSRCFYGYTHMGVFGQGAKGIEPVPVWRIAIGGDDQLPDPKLAAEAETWDPKKKILSTVLRYFEEVEKHGERITELSGVLDSLEAHSEGGLHGNRNLYVGSGRNEDLLLCLEKAQVMASTLGGSFPTRAMDGRWHDVLSPTGHAILFTFKDDYDERWAKVRQTRQEGEHALADTLATVARGIRFRKAAGSPLVVFNFQAWPVTGPVEFTPDGDAAVAILRDDAGCVVPMQAVADTGALDAGRVAFTARDVPACGYKTFYLTQSNSKTRVQPAVKAAAGPVENDHYRVEFKANGRVEIVDKKSGAVLGSNQHGGLGDLVFHNVPNSGDWRAVGPLGEAQAWKMQADRCRSVEGPVFASVRAEGTIGPHKLTREVRVWRFSRKIEYLIEIDAQPGSGVFCIRYPLGLEDGRVFAGIPFGAEPREDLGKEPFREEFFETGYPHAYYATRWTDVSTARRGYTFVCPAGMLTGYAYNRRGEGAIDFILHRLWPMPNGKHWSSKCHRSTTGAGRNRWRCALVPHEGTWREAATYRDALQQHVPLVAFSPAAGLHRASMGEKIPADGARLDQQASFAQVEPAGVVLSSLRLVDPPAGGEKPRWELRLYETLGRQTDVVVRLGCPIQGVRRTNLLGEPVGELEKIDVEGREIRFRIQPWKIVTLRVTPLLDG